MSATFSVVPRARSTSSTDQVTLHDMASRSTRDPPLLAKSATYKDWRKKVEIWARNAKTEDKPRLGGAVLMTLEGSAEEAVLELKSDVICSDVGLTEVLARLDQLYLKDDTLEKFQAFEAFDSYKRQSDVSIHQHIHDFDKLYHKLQTHGTTISEDLLAYKLLKSANLSKQDEKLAKGTVSELKLSGMKNQLKKIFADSESLSTPSSDSLTIHEINHASAESFEPEDTFYTDQRHSAPRRYNQQNQRSRPPFRSRPGRGRGNFSRRGGRGGTNPLDQRTGERSQCDFCGSTFHWVFDCPEKQLVGSRQHPVHQNNQSAYKPRYTFYEENPVCYEDEDIEEEQYSILLFQNDFDHPKNLITLVAESWNSAVLDSGATRTVCGRSWFQTYVDSLPDHERSKVTHASVRNLYRFGDENTALATESANIPAQLGQQKVLISTDIVDRDIPLLLSRESMKRANMAIDFKTDVAEVFDSKVRLNVTKSGHYTLPLTKPAQLLTALGCKADVNVTLHVASEMKVEDQAKKIHKQFAHAPLDRLLNLVKTAGEPWASDDALKNALKFVSDNCKTCAVYGNPKARPVVGLPMANHFLETVAMDLKFYNKKIILHMIDHATRLSSSVRVPSKKPREILRGIFSHWISIFGSTEKFLTDNGGEFLNEEFLELCESFNITVKTTGAEAPFSNGLVERHNQVVGNMLDRILEENPDMDFDIALAWVNNAKNSLTNINGFSPFQLAIGRNPMLPGVLTDKLPALCNTMPSSEVVRENLNALHSARVAFMESECSAKLRRALVSQTRSYSDVPIVSGDVVHYKRKDNPKWRGPATVLGKDGQQVLVKHGGYLIRVHPSRIRLSKNQSAAARFNQNSITPCLS